MYFERARVLARTLRFRLLLWHAGAVMVTGLVVLLGVRFSVQQSLLHDMDEVLNEDVAEIRLALHENPPEDLAEYQRALERKAQSHDFQGWFVQFMDESGKPWWSSTNAPPVLIEMNQTRLPSRANTHDGFRVVQQEVEIQSSGLPQALRVGSSLKFLENDLARIDRLVVSASLIVLLVSPLFGYILADQAVRPIADLLRAARSLRPAKMHDRLPIRGVQDELDQLATAFNQLLDRIADFLRQKQDFVADAAHELRTPLAAIRSMVEVQLNRENTSPAVQDTLVALIAETSSLEQLVNQLLLLAASDADRLAIHAEPVQLDQLVRRACDMFQAAADVNGVDLSLDRNDVTIVEGNAPHLRQVLNNLLDNAIKFSSPAGGDEGTETHVCGEHRPHVRVSLQTYTDDSLAVLTIVDEGIGIPAEHLPRVGRRFYRVDKARRRDAAIRGTGLGLSICLAIIDAHKGSLSVTSEPGKGTTVTIKLPLAADKFTSPPQTDSGKFGY